MGFFSKKKEKRDLTPEQPIFGTSLPFNTYYGNYSAMNISAVYRAVELISDSVAILPIKVKAIDTTHIDEIQHPVNLLFKGNLLNKYTFIKLLLQSVMLKGNGFAYIKRASDGTATDLVFLENNEVQIFYDKEKKDLHYICYRISSKKIEPCNMIHLVKNSYDGINGISVISFASRSVKLSNNTENAANSFFTNGCNLSGVLTVQGQLTDKQRSDIRKTWNEAYINGGNGLAVLQGNMEYKPIQLTASDSQMLESRQYNVQDIARFFGISPILLGDYSHGTNVNIEVTQQLFLMHTLQPYITLIEEEFTRKLFKPSESNLQINLDETALIKTDKAALANYYNTLLSNGVLCINEVRKDMGLNPIEGGDKHIIAYSDINQNIINQTEEKTDGENKD